ncbi:hypothetical protein ALC60_00302 [Trachymyrmex zeteki]|uniref:Uncharacterized protein n=1 Tax=Mycetomoellerius zeteki TaxID=64791 RepID=A0A151XK13_9HYME|nr:hypothetical protein ALC60_00302 [Trachymyrmex zeteki]
MGGFPFEISPREANVNPMLVHFPSSRREVAAGVKSECVRKGDRTGKLAKTVRKLLAERDGRVERGVLTRAHICPRGVLTMGRLANFDPPSYSIRSTNGRPAGKEVEDERDGYSRHRNEAWPSSRIRCSSAGKRGVEERKQSIMSTSAQRRAAKQVSVKLGHSRHEREFSKHQRLKRSELPY